MQSTPSSQRPRLNFSSDIAGPQGEAIRKGYLALLVQYLIDTSGFKEIDILEVGSWAGASAIAWAKALKDRGRKGRVLCVDRWEPYFDLSIDTAEVYQVMNRTAENGRIYDLFLQNVAASGVADIIEHIKGEATKVLPTLGVGHFQIAFIDACHRYEDALADIRNAMPLLCEGGILCGDDFELPLYQVSSSAHRAALGKGADYVKDPRSLQYYHPGVTQALAELFPVVSSWSGVWAMKKVAGGWQTIDLTGYIPQIPDFLAVDEPDPAPLPELIGSYRGVNIVRYAGKIYGLRRSLGPVDLMPDPDSLAEKYGPDNMVVRYTDDSARAATDAIEIMDQLKALAADQSALAERQGDLLQMIAAIKIQIAVQRQMLESTPWQRLLRLIAKFRRST